MNKKEWRKPEVRKIEAGAAENSTKAGSDPQPGMNRAS